MNQDIDELRMERGAKRASVDNERMRVAELTVEKSSLVKSMESLSQDIETEKVSSITLHILCSLLITRILI